MEPKVFKTKKFFDDRGFFSETYRKDLFFEHFGIDINFVQDNSSFSKKNVLRGLHYQWDKPMHKLVRVTYGCIIDVIVDIRPASSSYGKYFSYELSEENGVQLLVPAGFAHGFFVKSDFAYVQYKCSELYNKSGESGINPLDSSLKIDWQCENNLLIISEKDKASKSFEDYTKEPKF